MLPDNSLLHSAKDFKGLFSSEHEALFMTKLCTTPTFLDGLDSINCVIAYKTMNHELMHVNKKTLDYTGYKKLKNIVGKKDSDLIWQDFSDIYHKQEDDALNGHVYSALHPGKDVNGRDFLFFNRKYPWVNEKKEIIGIICHSVEIDNPNLIELGYVLKKTAINNSSGIHFLNKKNVQFEFTPRESECLFYIIRGKSAKNIGKILGISYRTVEIYIEHLKTKLKCNNKADLVDAAIKIGFVDIVPNSLFLTELTESLNE